MAELQDDGDILLSFKTDCANVKKYVEGFDRIKTEDVISLTNSAVMDPKKREYCSDACLVPSAIIHAAWLELGMLTKTKTKKVGSVCISFDD